MKTHRAEIPQSVRESLAVAASQQRVTVIGAVELIFAGLKETGGTMDEELAESITHVVDHQLEAWHQFHVRLDDDTDERLREAADRLGLHRKRAVGSILCRYQNIFGRLIARGAFALAKSSTEGETA